MTETQINNVFLERSYELDGEECAVKLYIGKPQQVSAMEWYCEYQIVGIGNELIKKTRGIDSVQALLNALQISPILLRSLAGNEYRITFLGEDELMKISWNESRE